MSRLPIEIFDRSDVMVYPRCTGAEAEQVIVADGAVIVKKLTKAEALRLSVEYGKVALQMEHA